MQSCLLVVHTAVIVTFLVLEKVASMGDQVKFFITR